MNEAIKVINDKELELAIGGGDDLFMDECNAIVAAIESTLYLIFEAIRPSYNYTDVGANFMSLIYEYAEYHFHVNGKKESEAKCQAIIITLEYNGFCMDEINALLDNEARRRHYI